MRAMHKQICSALFVLTGCWVPHSYADVPVVDLNQDNGNGYQQPDPNASRRSMSMEQRMNLLEQQMSNITQMNLPAKLDNLQQEIQQLNGQVEVEAHELDTLNEQQKNFYEDLNKRLNDLKQLISNNPTPAASNKPAKATAATAKNNTSIDSSASLPAPAVTTSSTGNEESDYQAAFNLLATKQNAAATSAFKTFLKNYPSGTYAPNAHYWLGELYSTQNQNDLASMEFNTVITQYPTNAKVSDAMLKLALIHDQAGQHDQARKELKKIVKQFPGSTAARLASMHLQQMKLTTSQ